MTTINQQKAGSIESHRVWDRSTRWFHWVNVVCVLLLIGIGTVILYGSALGISSEGKVTLKIMHAWVGYAFTLNLLWRFVWGFLGNKYARWSAILPFGQDYRASLRSYITGMKAGDLPAYRGHNPLGRLMITFLLALLTLQMATGLVLAGTDLYFPPFGHEFAEWATGAGEDHTMLEGLRPGEKEMLDPEGYAEMREFRKPFIQIHEYSFFVLLFAIAAHIGFVILAEVRDGHGLISAMFSGKKVLPKKPMD